MVPESESRSAYSLKLIVRQRARDLMRGRFVLMDNAGVQYTVTSNSKLEFSICRDGETLVEVKAAGKSRSVFWGRPRKFSVYFEGVLRGSLCRSVLYPLQTDSLVLDGKEYPLPDRLRANGGELGVHLSWGFLTSMPSVSVATEEALLPGLLLMAVALLRKRYVQD